MAIKRPVTLAQARRYPAAAARRESFCARMGGMRDKLTGAAAAGDPQSRINQALVAWDCDKPEGLRREHVSKGIRMAGKGVSMRMVGSEAGRRKNPVKAQTFYIHANLGYGKSEYFKVNVSPSAYAVSSAAREVAKHLGYPVLVSSRNERPSDGYPVVRYEFVDDQQTKAVDLFAYQSKREGVKYSTVRKTNPMTKNNLPDYRKKPDEELRYIIQDASEAAVAMRGHSPAAELKYLDQVNDATTVLYERAAKFRERKMNPEPSHSFAKIGKPFSYDGRSWKVTNYAHTGKTFGAVTTDRKSPFRREEFSVAEMEGYYGLAGLESLSRKKNPTGAAKVVFNRLLGGWFIVRGPHQTPIGGRFDSKAEALAHLNRNKNPLEPLQSTVSKSKKKANFPYCVESKPTENWSVNACFKTLEPAKEYARALSKKYPKLTIRVMHYAGGAM
jgi:hypothetical protein